MEFELSTHGVIKRFGSDYEITAAGIEEEKTTVGKSSEENLEDTQTNEAGPELV